MVAAGVVGGLIFGSKRYLGWHAYPKIKTNIEKPGLALSPSATERRTTKPAPRSANPNTALSLGRAERANADKSRLIGVLDAQREGNEAAAVPHSLSLTGIHLLSCDVLPLFWW